MTYISSLLKFFLFSALLVGCASRDHVHQTMTPESNSDGSMAPVIAEKPEGQYVFVNQKPYEIEESLNKTLNPILESLNGKTSFIELNTTEYLVDGSINLPSAINTRVVFDGNHARLTCKLSPSDYVIQKEGDDSFGLTGMADTFHEIKNLNLKGTGSGIYIRGGYQSRVINVTTSGLDVGVLMEFVLQGRVEDCMIKSPKDVGIKLTVIPKTNINASQCNMSSIVNNRIFAKNTDTGIFVGNSNLVKLEGNIIEGGAIGKGVHLHNNATTVISCFLKRTHFECASYSESCLYVSGFWESLVVDEMYYSGINGLAIKTAPSKKINLILKNSWLRGWKKGLYEEPKDWPNGKMAKGTYWYIYTREMSSIGSLFYGDLFPFYVFMNDSRQSLKPNFLPND